MASKFITYTKHGVAESSAMLGTTGGAHIANFVASADLDNGSVFARGTYAGNGLWNAKVAAKTDVLFIAITSPVIYEEYTKKMQEESNFYNAAGEEIRGYKAMVDDTVTLSAECFSGTPAVGKYVAQDGTGYKLVVSDTVPTGTAFVGFIYEVATNGNFRVLVQKNA